MHILVIEDHLDLAENIGDFLSGEGHTVDYASDGIVGLHLAATKRFDVIVLDLMLPGIEGIPLCERLRAECSDRIPILMISALTSLSDKLRGFASGADDYLTKPFALEELAARVHALGSRTVLASGPTLCFGEVEVDAEKMFAARAGKPLRLGQSALKVLELLVRAGGRVVTRSDLEYGLWGDEPPESDSLRTHIYSLRQELDRPFTSSLLETVHGVGYRLREEARTTHD